MEKRMCFDCARRKLAQQKQSTHPCEACAELNEDTRAKVYKRAGLVVKDMMKKCNESVGWPNINAKIYGRGFKEHF